jgi:hypothetical protein
MRVIELFLFRYRDPLTGRMVRSRYEAERSEIEHRHPGAVGLEETIERRELPENPCAHPSRAGQVGRNPPFVRLIS